MNSKTLIAALVVAMPVIVASQEPTQAVQNKPITVDGAPLPLVPPVGNSPLPDSADWGGMATAGAAKNLAAQQAQQVTPASAPIAPNETSVAALPASTASAAAQPAGKNPKHAKRKAPVQKVPALAVSPEEESETPYLIGESERGTPLPPPPLKSPGVVRLDDKEATGIALANEWKTKRNMPRRGGDGSVKYLYGATLPTMVCTPLEVCAIKLQKGETVNDVHAGDTTRWKITPATSGSGKNAITYVVVKPTDAGLTTNLFITTERRTYTIKLASTQREWIPILSFDYPDEVDAAWDAYRQGREQNANANTMSNGQNLANLDFSYSMTGDHPRWTPLRVYSDGVKTYIQFPSADFAGSEAPALLALGKESGGGWFGGGKIPAEQLVNYRAIGDRYVVDQVIDRAALISGVGDSQVRVVIEHQGAR